MGTRFNALLTWIKGAFLSFQAKVRSDVSELWQKDKGFLLLFGVVILGVKFRQILISLIVSGSKVLYQNTEKTNDTLQKHENEANDQANQLIENAKEEAAKDTSVDDDWNLGK